ncbi:MAG: hypothetical protein KDD51_10960 [Bdellovibrionales bacterium]|nr:hypothetical protein [Bdellovibrionales bacterium]
MLLPEIETIYLSAVVSLVLFAVIGVFDGVYYHLYRYNLQSHPEARLEHWIHTLRAFVFAAFSLLIFVMNVGGKLLWVAVGLVALDVILEAIDILVEKEARAKLGGISSGEALVHVMATACKSVALALMAVAKPTIAWKLDAPVLLDPYPMFVILSGTVFSISTGVGGIVQVILMKPIPSQAKAKAGFRLAISGR